MTRHFQLLTVLLLLGGCAVKKQVVQQWKNDAEAAICLTYDDGMQTHLDQAIPQLNLYDLKGTFYINTVQGRENIIRWKVAAKNGHELGNHSLFHPCPSSFGWQEELATDHYTVTQMLKEIEAVNHILANLDKDKVTTSYAYPCNNTMVSDTNYIDALQKSKLVAYARGGGDQPTVIADFSNLNIMHVYSWAVPEGTELPELIAFAEKARKLGGLAVFQFHGVGGEWIKISEQTHEGLLKYLSEHSSEFWVAPFSEIMDHLSRR